MTKGDRAKLTQLLVNVAESLQQMLDILLPDDETDEEKGCPHPKDEVEHEETMDDEGSLYRCRKCGAESKVPFTSRA